MGSAMTLEQVRDELSKHGHEFGYETCELFVQAIDAHLAKHSHKALFIGTLNGVPVGLHGTKESVEALEAHLANKAVARVDGWLPIESAPRDGQHILALMITPTFDEDSSTSSELASISVAYWFLGHWMQYPASPRFVQGQRATHWMPLPPGPKL